MAVASEAAAAVAIVEAAATVAGVILRSHLFGAARMGPDLRTSVVGPDFETHEVERLFVADGSVVSGPLGVNPQMTIMAMALKAGETIDARLGA